jgi:hypothetical protein
MWIPQSAAEVEQAATRGDLEETHTFDAKVALPGPKKNRDLAEDVAAMAVDGGVLLYGLGEDKHKRLTVLAPIALEGARERVAQIVETSISEPPFIRVHALPTEVDAAKGYLVVVVPQSERAPHQVISGADMRYYGRGATGNRRLSEADVAALYTRRKQWEADRDELLERELSSAPEPDPSLGYMAAYARPVAPDDSMVEGVSSAQQEIAELLRNGARSWGHMRPDREGRSYDPDLRNAPHLWRHGADGWSLSTSPESDEEPKYTVRMNLDFDGTGHLFCGRVADTTGGGLLVFFDSILAGNLASFLGAMGALYGAAGYVGYVDVGVGVTGIGGATPYGLHHWGRDGFLGSTYTRTGRFSAGELKDDAKRATLTLTGRLLEAMHSAPYSPFEEPPPAEPATE